MFLFDKRDKESFIRERSLETLKENKYLLKDDIVLVAENSNFYKIVDTETDIPINNEKGLYAQIMPSDIIGNITTTDRLKEPVNINLKGDIRGTVSFDGSKDVDINTEVLKLTVPVELRYSGDVTGHTMFDGSSNVDIDITVLDDSHKHSNETITSLDATKINSGVLAVERIPKLNADQTNSGIFHPDRIPYLNANKINEGIFSHERIPFLDADKINTGILHSDRIPILDASKIGTGIIDIARLPAAALERLVEVETDAERFKLTKSQIQLGDTVKVKSTLKMYKVIDDNQLNNENGYTVFVAGRAAEVPWTGVTDKPVEFPPIDHTHTKEEITNFPDKMVNPNFLRIVTKDTEFNYDGSSAVRISLKPTDIGLADINHTHTGSDTFMTGYTTNEELENPILPTDDLTTAIYKIENKTSINRGELEPVDKNIIWYNYDNDDDNDYIPPEDTNLYDDIVNKINTIKEDVDKVVYSLNYKIDGGERIKPSSTVLENPPSGEEYPEISNEYTPTIPGEFSGIVKNICIARGKKDCMGSLMPGEFFLDLYTKELFIGGSTGLPILVGKEGGVGSGSNNLTGEFLELTNEKGEVYKIKVNNNGQLEIYKSLIDKQPLPNPNEPGTDGIFHENWDEYKSNDGTGLCINQIYSGGPLNSDNTPVSHSFIEIYNHSERDINLRGLSIQYAKIGKEWKVCPLNGILPGNTSYLIRCVQNTNPYKLACRVKIKNFDLDWNQELSPTGMKVALVVGTEPLDTENPYRDPKNGSPSVYRYIDMLGAGGKESTQKIDYQEGYFARHCLDKNTACCRTFRVGKKDQDDNLLDTIAIDYRYADIEAYGPRCRADGPWDIYRDKIKLAPNRPSMIFITFGKKQSTRIFTWQSLPSREGFLKIKKKGEDSWKTYKATLRNITHHDTAAVTNKVQVDNLTTGTYIYKCGKEGEWSDEYEFKVFDEKYGDFTSPLSGDTYADRSVKFLQTTDQQGWSEEEYLAWKYAHDFIYQNEKVNQTKPLYDWRINTGDASQNGNRAYEWRYYYDAAKEDLPNTVEMLIIGNNDLVDKKKSKAYTYYSNYEESPYPGCFEFFIGDIHFLCWNTWAGVDTDYTDTDGAIGYTKKQIEWLKEKLRGPRKRWTIGLTHVAPYTIVQQKQGQPYKEAIEGNNGEYAPMDLVICGHNHAYSRTQPMLNNQVDKLNGVYHVMSQATGYKLSGKEKPKPEGQPYYGKKPDGSFSVGVPGNPTYILWEITKDYIEFKAYMIKGIINKDPVTKEITYGNFEDYSKELIDTFKFYHRSVRAEHQDEL